EVPFIGTEMLENRLHCLKANHRFTRVLSLSFNQRSELTVIRNRRVASKIVNPTDKRLKLATIDHRRASWLNLTVQQNGNVIEVPRVSNLRLDGLIPQMNLMKKLRNFTRHVDPHSF